MALEMYKLVYTSQAEKDAKKISQMNLKANCLKLIDILKTNPYQNPLPYEKLLGDLQGFCSRRINRQHRLVYKVYEEIKTVKILRMWSHYE